MNFMVYPGKENKANLGQIRQAGQRETAATGEL
jgi:hypothetical protein